MPNATRRSTATTRTTTRATVRTDKLGRLRSRKEAASGALPR